MTDGITKILANAKKVFKTKDNNLKYVVIADDENGKETNYTLNFNYDGITVGRTIVNDNKIEVITNNQEYNRDLFLSILTNYNILVGNIDEFNKNINLTLNTIPTLVFSNSVFKKEGIDGEEIYDGDKYIDDFIAYNNSNILINNTNYFTFLKITVEAGNIEIFDYLRFTYDEYINNLNEEQMAILIYTACKRNPTFITKMRELDFTFGFEVLKLVVDNNDYKVLEYLYNDGIDINAVNNRFQYIPTLAYITGNYEPRTILDYAIKINNIEMIKYFLAIKDVNIGKTIVLGIVRNPEIIELLYERDDIMGILELKEPLGGWSVAHEIAGNEDPEVVKLLFRIKENIKKILEFEDYNSPRSLVANVIARNKNPKVVKLLFEISREDMDDILKPKGSYYYQKYENVIISIAKNENPEVVKLLFETKYIADNILEFRDSYDFTVFHVMAMNRNLEVVKLLFERPDIKNILRIKNEYGQTITNIMANNRSLEVIKFLLARKDVKLKKEDINSIKKNFSNNEEITNLLLARGLINANGDIPNKKTCTIC